MKMFVEPADIYLYMDIVDFRKSINGLIVVVEQQMQLSPFRDALFVFCNKKRDKLKILYWVSIGTLMAPPICGLMEPLKTVIFALKQGDYFSLFPPRPV